MSLPASQYSVLDGSKVERLDEETFRVFVAPFRFFSLEVQPVLTLQVQAQDAGCVITMHGCELRGSKLLEAQNDNFAARMTNQVQWRHSDDPGHSKVASDTSVDVALVIPRWFVVPRGVVRSTGNKVIESILKRAVPQFLQQLERDYRAWAAGDPDRQPLASADLC